MLNGVVSFLKGLVYTMDNKCTNIDIGLHSHKHKDNSFNTCVLPYDHILGNPTNTEDIHATREGVMNPITHEISNLPIIENNITNVVPLEFLLCKYKTYSGVNIDEWPSNLIVSEKLLSETFNSNMMDKGINRVHYYANVYMSAINIAQTIEEDDKIHFRVNMKVPRSMGLTDMHTAYAHLSLSKEKDREIRTKQSTKAMHEADVEANSVSIESMYCDCKNGIDGVCSHDGALLLMLCLLGETKRMHLMSLMCTETLAAWNEFLQHNQSVKNVICEPIENYKLVNSKTLLKYAKKQKKGIKHTCYTDKNGRTITRKIRQPGIQKIKWDPVEISWDEDCKKQFLALVKIKT